MPNPCPFCAAVLDWTIMRVEFDGEQCRQVKCNHCGARGPHSAWMQPSDKHKMMQDAVAEWNKANKQEAWVLLRFKMYDHWGPKQFLGYWPQRPDLDQLQRQLESMDIPSAIDNLSKVLRPGGEAVDERKYCYQLIRFDPANRPLDDG